MPLQRLAEFMKRNKRKGHPTDPTPRSCPAPPTTPPAASPPASTPASSNVDRGKERINDAQAAHVRIPSID